MSAIRKSILSAALLLAAVMGSAAPAAAQGPGIWVYLTSPYSPSPPCDPYAGACPSLTEAQPMTITLINLTDTPLIISGNTLVAWNKETNHPLRQSHPFQVTDNGPVSVDPYRSATWKSVYSWDGDGDAAWDGSMAVTPQGWVISQWSLYVTCYKHEPKKLGQSGKGTWIYLRTPTNPEWGTLEFLDSSGSFYVSGWRYGIWSTIIPVAPRNAWPMYNVMTASSNVLAVSLYSPDNKHITLVVRQTHWDGTRNDDYKGWQLDFADNASDTVP